MLPKTRRYLELLCYLVYLSSCLLLAVGEESTNSPPPICMNNLTDVILSIDPRLADANGPVIDGFDSCFDFKPQLNDQQLRVCNRDKRYLNCFAYGMRKAVDMCGRVFANSTWNCTHVVRDLVFGRFVHENDVRERSTVMAMLSAGVMYELTACCRERMLLDCSCNYSVPGPFSWRGKTIHGEDAVYYKGCADRLNIPADRTRTLLRIDSTSNNNCDKVDSHNAELGIKMVSVTRQHCHCHGLSASCTVQTCKYRMQPFSNFANKMLMKYSGAVKVHPPTNGRFVAHNENADNPTDEDLVYICDTPNLCFANGTLDIPGTSGRQCYPGVVGKGSCDLLCCGRGHYKKTRIETIYELKVVGFVLQPIPVGTKTMIEYFCN